MPPPAGVAVHRVPARAREGQLAHSIVPKKTHTRLRLPPDILDLIAQAPARYAPKWKDVLKVRVVDAVDDDAELLQHLRRVLQLNVENPLAYSQYVTQ